MSIKNTTINVAGVEINVKRKSMKTLRLKVNADIVSISAPLHASNYTLSCFAKNNMEWIKRNLQLAKDKQEKKESLLNPGHNIKLWGKNIALVFNPRVSRKDLYIIKHDQLTLPVDASATYDDKLVALEDFYRFVLARQIEKRLPIWESIVGVKLTHWGIRKMKTRWGSCNIDRQRISLNLDLARWPMHCLDYVIVHELVHLHESHHTRRFWELVASFMPTWQTYHTMLQRSEIPDL